jgi:hypothetical protein
MVTKKYFKIVVSDNQVPEHLDSVREPVWYVFKEIGAVKKCGQH